MLGHVFALIVIGLGIGWLTGMSATPVVSIVITALVGAISSVAAIATGIRGYLKKAKKDSSTGSILIDSASILPVPFAWIVFGIIVGSCFGIYSRTHNWLGMDIYKEVEIWEDLGLEKDFVTKSLFEQRLKKLNEGVAYGG
jgi:hypothetical protein